MRGQLLLGEKGWKERRDLARADEASSAALCFVIWVFLSFISETSDLADSLTAHLQDIASGRKELPPPTPHLAFPFAPSAGEQSTLPSIFAWGEKKREWQGDCWLEQKLKAVGWAVQKAGIKALCTLVMRGEAWREGPERQNQLQNGSSELNRTVYSCPVASSETQAHHWLDHHFECHHFTDFSFKIQIMGWLIICLCL